MQSNLWRGRETTSFSTHDEVKDTDPGGNKMTAILIFRKCPEDVLAKYGGAENIRQVRCFASPQQLQSWMEDEGSLAKIAWSDLVGPEEVSFEGLRRIERSFVLRLRYPVADGKVVREKVARP
jgi:hypothetical protein